MFAWCYQDSFVRSFGDRPLGNLFLSSRSLLEQWTRTRGLGSLPVLLIILPWIR